MKAATRYTVSLRGRILNVAIERLENGRALATLDGQAPVEVVFSSDPPDAVAFVDGRVVELCAFGHETSVRGEHAPVRVERQELIRDRARRGSAKRSGAVRAPMPGRVVKVLVESGDAVEPGAGVIVIEAMKMENELSCPMKGTVARVLVKSGDAVERDALLVEIA